MPSSPSPAPQLYLALTLLGSTALATKWYLCMARTHWQMEVQALDTLAMAAGWNSSLSMYGWMALITASPMLSWTREPWASGGYFPGRTRQWDLLRDTLTLLLCPMPCAGLSTVSS